MEKNETMRPSAMKLFNYLSAVIPENLRSSTPAAQSNDVNHYGSLIFQSDGSIFVDQNAPENPQRDLDVSDRWS